MNDDYELSLPQCLYYAVALLPDFFEGTVTFLQDTYLEYSDITEGYLE